MGTEVISNKEEADNAEKPSKLEAQIIRQIEYYFGNFNLGRDKFLKEEVQKDEGWVSLELMVKFNRLKQITVDFTTISDALKKSPNQLMEVNEDCTKIRRRVPLSENVDKDEIEDRTLYVKGFHRNTELDEILDYFKEYKAENITMRKKKQGNKMFFKGSVFVTFETQEGCDAFLEKKGLRFEKTELLKEKKKDYVKRKDIFFDNLRAEKEKKTAERKASGENDDDICKGCLLKVSGLGKSMSRDKVRSAVEEFGKVAFVEYFDGKPEAIVRFDKPIVSDILKDITEEDGEKKMEIDSEKATLSVIDGEEEDKYLKNVVQFKANAKNKFGNKQGNRGRFNKRPFHHGKRNRGGRNNGGNEDRPAKRPKAESTEGEKPAEVSVKEPVVASETME